MKIANKPQAAENAANLKKILAAGCLLVFAVLASYLPSAGNEFVEYDDPQYVTTNSHVNSGFSWKAIQWAFGSTEQCNWHPLTWLSHILDCQFYGLRPTGHHVTSILIHSANAVLALLVLRTLTGAFWRSFFAAALFALHPLRVESVAWIAERKDVLSTFFFLLTLWCYARYALLTRIESSKLQTRNGRNLDATSYNPETEHPARRADRYGITNYCLALVFFALGLLSKPMLVTSPFVLLLLDFWPLKRLRFTPPGSLARSLLHVLPEKVPFFIFSAASCLITFIAQNRGGAVKSFVALPLGLRAENAAVSVCSYTAKLLWPQKLSIFYPYPARYPAIEVLLACLLIATVSVATLLAARRQPYWAFGWFWYLGTLVPVIGLVQVGYQSMADRYTYIPSLGVCVAIAWGAWYLVTCWKLPRIMMAPLATAALLFLCVLTWHQTICWKDSEALFRHALAAIGDDGVIRSNLGVALAKKGREEEARYQFERAASLEPNDAGAHFNLATTLAIQNRLDEAISEFELCLKLNPKDAAACANYGSALIRKGRLDAGISELCKAIDLAPGQPQTYVQLAEALEKAGRYDEAAARYEAALRIAPNLPKLQFKLGLALVQMNKLGEAVSHFREAVARQQQDADAHYFLAGALFETGNLDEAILQFRDAISLQPEKAEAHADLARALDAKGYGTESIAEFRAALNLSPSSADLHNSFGAALAKSGRLKEADTEFREAIRLNPEFSEAETNLLMLLETSGHK